MSRRSGATPREVAIYEIAQKDPRIKDGHLEIDMGAQISEGDENGAYIQTWMWVDFKGTKLDKCTSSNTTPT